MDEDPTWYEVDLGPGHIVLDGDPAPAAKDSPHLFGPCLLWPRSPISATAELLLPLCCWLIEVVLEKRPLNGCLFFRCMTVKLLSLLK